MSNDNNVPGQGQPQQPPYQQGPPQQPPYQQGPPQQPPYQQGQPQQPPYQQGPPQQPPYQQGQPQQPPYQQAPAGGQGPNTKMVAVIAVVVVLLLAGGITAAVLLSGDDGDSSADTSTPEGVVEAYIESYFDGDCAEAEKYVGSEEFPCDETEQETPPSDYEVGEAEIDGDQARVPVEATFDGEPWNSEFALEKQDGDWKIVTVEDGATEPDADESDAGDPDDLGVTPQSQTEPSDEETLEPKTRETGEPGTEAAQVVDQVFARVQEGGDPREVIDFETDSYAEQLVEDVAELQGYDVTFEPAEEMERFRRDDTRADVEVPITDPNGVGVGFIGCALTRDAASDPWFVMDCVKIAG